MGELTQTAVGTGKLLHKLEIPKFHDEAALICVEKDRARLSSHRGFRALPVSEEKD